MGLVHDYLLAHWLDRVKIPYKLVAAVDLDTRRQNMLSAIARNLPRLEQVPIQEGKTLHVACYGPSLQDTWQDIQHPCISMSGATRFLADRGFVPDYHIDMDPRPYKVQQITPPVPGVKYLIASVCHPIYFDTLKDQDVTLWHCVSGGQEEDRLWLSAQDYNQLLVSTGSNVGLAALHIGGILGFRHFEIHGMDGSYAADGQRHAAQHFGKIQRGDQTWRSQNVNYRTSKVMANGVAECINGLRVYPIFVVFHGWGLLQSLVEEENLPNACTARQTEKAAVIRQSRALFVEVPDTLGRSGTASVWDAICLSELDPNWIGELQEKYAEAETLRSKAKFNTGSISLEAGLLLRAICNWKRPDTVIEVGTFIGKSTQALHARRIYTCDKDNDCIPSTDVIRTHPYMTSTEMLRQLHGEGVKADLFFFDGRLRDEDIPLVLALSAPEAVYVVDDYVSNQKGVANIAKLLPHLPKHGLVTPYKPFAGRATIAMLVPTREQGEVVAA